MKSILLMICKTLAIISCVVVLINHVTITFNDTVFKMPYDLTWYGLGGIFVFGVAVFWLEETND